MSDAIAAAIAVHAGTGVDKIDIAEATRRGPHLVRGGGTALGRAARRLARPEPGTGPPAGSRGPRGPHGPPGHRGGRRHAREAREGHLGEFPGGDARVGAADGRIEAVGVERLAQRLGALPGDRRIAMDEDRKGLFEITLVFR